MNEIPGGFWRVVAEGFVQGQLNKPFFGHPYIKLGQCVGLWSYMFELGGILGAKHAMKRDAFVSGFLGMSSEAGAAERVLIETANNLLERHSLDSMKFWDYVGADLAGRLGYKGVLGGLMMERGNEKVPPKMALIDAWEYASGGVALGTARPDMLRAMFERTYAQVGKEKWEKAYAGGLDIGPEQPRTNYQEAEEADNKKFVEFCRTFRSDLYSVLKD
jgi:hypothetical protein